MKKTKDSVIFNVSSWQRLLRHYSILKVKLYESEKCCISKLCELFEYTYRTVNVQIRTLFHNLWFLQLWKMIYEQFALVLVRASSSLWLQYGGFLTFCVFAGLLHLNHTTRELQTWQGHTLPTHNTTYLLPQCSRSPTKWLGCKCLLDHRLLQGQDMVILNTIYLSLNLQIKLEAWAQFCHLKTFK